MTTKKKERICRCNNMPLKTEAELRAKLCEGLAVDARNMPPNFIFTKAAMCKTLLWALGENDDDRWFIRAKPGPAEDSRGKDRN